MRALFEVFKIEVLMSGRKHFVEKRYSEFHALHKKLKKCIRTPEIPSKHVRNWIPKVLEQRRQGLELYLQTVILENEELPKIFLDFLNVRHVPTLPKAESCGSFDETESEESSKLSHQPVLLFLRDPYVLPKANGNQTCHLLTVLYDLPCSVPTALLLIQAKSNNTGLKPNNLPIRQ
uniref:Sorting nexin 24 n=1 Tax=Meleagris gallopavo TaxID=9103 RepID=A0A803XL09_MELGA